MKVDPDRSSELSRIVSSLIVPRPIGWISSRSADGTDNLAPFSFFQVLNAERPPILMFSGGDREDGTLKDSVDNALETGAFVHNLVTRDQFEEMYRSSDPIPAGKSEFEYADVELAAAETVPAPRVKQAKAHVECVFHDDVRIGDHKLVMGEIRHIHVDESLLTDGDVDVSKVDAIGRLTGEYFGAIDRFRARDGPPNPE